MTVPLLQKLSSDLALKHSERYGVPCKFPTLEIDQHAKINCVEPNLKTTDPSSFFEVPYQTAAQGGANVCNFDENSSI